MPASSPSARPRKRFLSPSQAAELLGVSQQSITSWIRKGRLEAVQVGIHYGITADEIERIRQELATA
jgi:excisionase family DNA binding protein